MNSIVSYFERPIRADSEIISKSIKKGSDEKIGIVIAGGLPECPAIYVINVIKGSPCEMETDLEPGDELVEINGNDLFNRTKHEVAMLIKKQKDNIEIAYIKLSEMKMEQYLPDLLYKKLKHQLTEKLSTDTTEWLGINRAVLAKDDLVMKLELMEDRIKIMKNYRSLMDRLFTNYSRLMLAQEKFSQVLDDISSHDLNQSSQNAYERISNYERKVRSYSTSLNVCFQHIPNQIDTFLNNIVGDMKQSLKKYYRLKFAYLSYCLQAKEFEEEETDLKYFGESCYRLESGNFEYRTTLKKCFQLRKQFNITRLNIKMKLEFFDQKYTEIFIGSIKKYISSFANCYSKCLNAMMSNDDMLRIDPDATNKHFPYLFDPKITLSTSSILATEKCPSARNIETSTSETALNSQPDLIDMDGIENQSTLSIFNNTYTDLSDLFNYISNNQQDINNETELSALDSVNILRNLNTENQTELNKSYNVNESDQLKSENQTD